MSEHYTCPECGSHEVDDDWPDHRAICEDCNHEGNWEDFLLNDDQNWFKVYDREKGEYVDIRD